jgi:molecular chaperone IbpA
MTRNTTLDFPYIARGTVGFDRLFNEIERSLNNSQSNNYPPYNIVKLNDTEYMISIAVAGFSMDDLEITLEKNILTVEGAALQSDETVNYLHKGIGGRNFRRVFTLADYIEVANASLSLGMLHIHLKRVIPEELQPKKIEITAGNEFTPTVNNLIEK